MATVLESMATKKDTNSQVIVSTHSPYFVSSRGFESIRMVRKHRQDHCSLVSYTTYAKLEQSIAAALQSKPSPPSVIMARVEQIMQPSQRELYFTRVAVLVEGQEDIAFVATHLQLSGKFDEFRQFGCHFVITGGKDAMSRPLAIANELHIPTFVVFDGDTDDTKNLAAQERDNACLLRLCGHTGTDFLPAQPIWGETYVMWHTDIMAVVKSDFADCWDKVVQEVRTDMNLPGGDKGIRPKNSILICPPIL